MTSPQITTNGARGPQKQGAAWDTRGTSKDGPGDSQRELQVVIPGPRPTLVRSAEL